MKCVNKNSLEYKAALEILEDVSKVDALTLACGRIPTKKEALKFKSSFDPVTDVDPTNPENSISKFESLISAKKDRNNRVLRRINANKVKTLKLRKSLLKNGATKEQLKTNKDLKALMLTRNKLEKTYTDLKRDIDELYSVDKIDVIEKFAIKDLNVITRLLKKPNKTATDLVDAIGLIRTWKNILNLSTTNIFTEEELTSKLTWVIKTQELMSKYSVMFDQKFNEIIPIVDKLYQQLGEEAFKETLTDELRAYFTNLSEVGNVGGIGQGKALLFSIAESHEPSYQLLHQMYKTAMSTANAEIDDLATRIAKAFKDITTDELDLFYQRASNTDNRQVSSLVSAFTYEYETRKQDIIDNLNRKTNSIFLNTKLTNKERLQRLKKLNFQTSKALNSISTVIDPNLLYTIPKQEQKYVRDDKFTVEGAKTYKQKLLKMLNGNTHLLERFLRQVDENVTLYRQKLEIAIENIKEEYPEDIVLQEALIDEFIQNNSPFIKAHSYKTGNITAKSIRAGIFDSEHVVTIANKTDSDGNATNFYDGNFTKIMSNEKLAKAYWLAHAIYTSAYQTIPNDQLEGAHMLAIFPVEKNLMENFAKDGVITGIKTLYDKVRMFGTAQENAPIPAQMYQKTQLEGVNNPFKQLIPFLKQKKISYAALHNNESVSPKLINDWKIEYLNEVSKNNSKDFTKVLQGFAAATIVYNNKALIEDSTFLMHSMINTFISNKILDSNTSTDKFNKKNAAKLQNSLDTLNNTLSIFYGYHPKQKTQKSKKALTSVKLQDKEAYKKLEDTKKDLETLFESKKITAVELAREYKEIAKAKRALEFDRDLTTILDGLNAYIRMKTIGWNVFSGMSNILFGIVANTMIASDGRVINSKNLAIAYKMVMSSVLKSNSMGIFATPLAKKISNIMSRHDIFKKSKYEIAEKGINTGRKESTLLSTLSPWNFMERGEYFNQAPLVIAMLLSNTVTIDGKEVSMFDAMLEDGSFKDGVSEEDIAKFHRTKSAMDRLIARGHGNYDTKESPLLLNNKIMYRLIKTFKTWMPQAYYTRFGEERPSFATGTVEKGRYLSYKDSIKTGIGGRSRMGSTAFIAKQLLKKVYSNTGFDYYYNTLDKSKTLSVEDYEQLEKEEKENYTRSMTAVDAANMRANLTELYWVTASTVSMALMSMLAAKIGADDDDDDETSRYLSYSIINLLGRLQTDLFMWVSPIEMHTLVKDPIIITKLVTESTKLISDSFAIAFGDRPLHIQTGSYAKENRLTRDLSAVFPFTAQIKTLSSLGKGSYKNNKSFWYYRLTDVFGGDDIKKPVDKYATDEEDDIGYSDYQ